MSILLLMHGLLKDSDAQSSSFLRFKPVSREITLVYQNHTLPRDLIGGPAMYKKDFHLDHVTCLVV
jgi:hypothetical protein